MCYQTETLQSRPQTAPTVTELEKKHTQNKMNNLKFDMEIIVGFFLNKFNLGLRFD